MRVRVRHVVCAAIAATVLAACEPSRDGLIAQHGATINGYCLDCHNDLEQVAGLTLESICIVDICR